MNSTTTLLASPADLCRTLLRHKKKFLAFLVAAVSLTIFATFTAPRTYRSEGKLFVRLGRENVGLDATATLGQNPVVAIPYSREDEMNSMVELFKSRQLSEQVVDAIGPEIILGSGGSSPLGKLQSVVMSWISSLAKKQEVQSEPQADGPGSLAGTARSMTPRDRAILKFEQQRRLSAVKKTNVIQVSFEARSPQLAQAVLTKYIDSYLEKHVHSNRTAGTHKFLVEQTARLKRQLTSSEEELHSIQQRTGIAEPHQQQQQLVQRLGQLEDELLQTEIAFATSLSQARLLHSSLNGLDQLQVIGRTVGMDRSVADDVRQQLYELQLREQEYLAKYTPEHIAVRKIRRQIAGVQAALARSEPAAITTPDGDLAATGAERETREEAPSSDEQLIAREPALRSLQVKTERLKEQLAGAKEELQNFQLEQLRIARLQREISLHDAAYRNYADNLERSHIDRSLEEERISNINVVQPATYDPKPISPRVLLNVALGLGLALSGGLGLVFLTEFLDRTLKSPREIEERLGVRNLVTIPLLRADQLKLSGRMSPR